MTDMWQSSAAAYEPVCQEDVKIPMRDGTRLATDLYLPGLGDRPAPGRFPVILERTPYNKCSSVKISTGQFFARRGYICAFQDVRGRFASEGRWEPFVREPEDGYDTVEWLAAHPHSDGRVGTMGSSYAGSDQSALATLDPPGLKTMIIAVGAYNYYRSAMRHNGALELRWVIYAFKMALDSKEAHEDPALAGAIRRDYERIFHWLNQRPLRPEASALERLPTYARWARDILAHCDYDAYWQQRGYAYSDYFDQHADVPTLHFGGWYDSYARATCENFVALSRRKNTPQRLIMGPWYHDGWQSLTAGELHFGHAAMLNYNDLRLMWFDHHLKDLSTPAAEWPAAQYFLMGSGSGGRLIDGSIDYGGHWRSSSHFPPSEMTPTTYHLHHDGRLDPQGPAADIPPSRYRFDPSDPTPTVGGCISAANEFMPPGGFDQYARPAWGYARNDMPLSARGDVLCFQTDPLPHAVTIAGPITVVLYASSSAVDTDFTAKLIDVFPADAEHALGPAINLTDSIIRARYRDGEPQARPLEPGRVYELRFELYPTATVFQAGHRIRLDISSSNFPRFDVNPNTGSGDDNRIEIAHQVIYHDAEHPSHIVLPTLESTRDEPAHFAGHANVNESSAP